MTRSTTIGDFMKVVHKFIFEIELNVANCWVENGFNEPDDIALDIKHLLLDLLPHANEEDYNIEVEYKAG